VSWNSRNYISATGSGRVFAVVLALAAYITTARSADAQGQPASADSQQVKLEEVVVTAQKRQERLQDVPVPMAVVRANTLVENNKTRVEDYFFEVPGLSFSSDGNDATLMSIRGLSSGAGVNPTVQVVVDDIPFQLSTTNSGGAFVPELDPNDLARVEVLRGPQGTLYGGNSLGGLVRYVTVDPSTTGSSGHLQVGTSSVHNAAVPGYNVSGSINVPISETLAVRATAYTHEDAGYIDNPVLGREGVNQSRTTGAHLSGLWSPSEAFSFKLGAFYQYTKSDGSEQVQFLPGLGDLQQDLLPGTGGHIWDLRAVTATAHARFGAIELTSVTGYLQRKVYANDDFVDYASIYDPLANLAFGTPPGTTGSDFVARVKAAKLSQELRLWVPFSKTFDWLTGLYYTHETGWQNNDVQELFSNSGQSAGDLWSFDWHGPYIESAVFTDLTIHFTSRFDVQLGGRESHIEQTYNEIDSGPYATLTFGGSPYFYPSQQSSANAFTYLFTPRFKVSDDLMTYARLASGYRPGGPNAGALVYGYPNTFSPDKTNNYEIGVKGDAFAHRLSFDASAYYIDWKGIQLQAVYQGFYPYIQNGSRAKSQGVELSSQWRPLLGLTLAGWVAYDDALLTEVFPPNGQNYGVSGNRLPFVSRLSGSLSADEEFPLGTRLTGFVGATTSYIGGRLGNFTPTIEPGVPPPRQIYPGFATTELRGGVRCEQWQAQLFVTNLADKRGLLSGGLGASPYSTAFSIIHPRTVGLNISVNVR
jgi:iron complex outermembrane receptor protein